MIEHISMWKRFSVMEFLTFRRKLVIKRTDWYLNHKNECTHTYYCFQIFIENKHEQGWEKKSKWTRASGWSFDHSSMKSSPEVMQQHLNRVELKDFDEATPENGFSWTRVSGLFGGGFNSSLDLDWEQPDELARVSGEHDSWMPHWCGAPDMSHWRDDFSKQV